MRPAYTQDKNPVPHSARRPLPAPRPRQIQRQQPLQYRLIAQPLRPAVGPQHGRVQRAVDVVQLLDVGRADGAACLFIEGRAVEGRAFVLAEVDQAVVEVGQGIICGRGRCQLKIRRLKHT